MLTKPIILDSTPEDNEFHYLIMVANDRGRQYDVDKARPHSIWTSPEDAEAVVRLLLRGNDRQLPVNVGNVKIVRIPVKTFPQPYDQDSRGDFIKEDRWTDWNEAVEYFNTERNETSVHYLPPRRRINQTMTENMASI